MIPTSYQIWLLDNTGTRQGLLVDNEGPPFGVADGTIQNLYLTHQTNRRGALRLTFDGNSNLIPLITADTLIEVYRSNHQAGFGYYLEWEGFIDPNNSEFSLLENGTVRATFFAIGYSDLLYREVIAYFSGTSYTTKTTAPGETQLKAFVNENIGPAASSTDRLYNGIRSGLSIQADASRGTSWSGSKAHRKLSDVCIEIAESTGLVFDIVGTSNATFEFQVFNSIRGVDRTQTGLDRSTGLNAAGNAPLVLSDKRDDFETARINRNNRSSSNVVLVMGEDDPTTPKGERFYRVVEDTALRIEGKWSQRADFVNANQENTQEALLARGTAELEAKRPQIDVNFDIKQTQTLAYGKRSTSTPSNVQDFWWGDLVEIDVLGVQTTKTLSTVAITLNENGEKITVSGSDPL